MDHFSQGIHRVQPIRRRREPSQYCAECAPTAISENPQTTARRETNEIGEPEHVPVGE